MSIAAPRLRSAGVGVDEPFPAPEHRLYRKLAETDPDSAHSRYNALLRRLTSFESALECVADAERLRRFLRELGREASEDTAIYLTGGATAVTSCRSSRLP